MTDKLEETAHDNQAETLFCQQLTLSNPETNM